jgi:outer membrane protein assembly factor BamB
VRPLALAGAASVLAAGGPRSPAAPAVRPPVRLHADAGWGVPAADDRAVYFLSPRHELVCVDRRGGATRWKNRLGASDAVTAGASVVLAGPLVVAGDSDLFAYDRLTGVMRWRFGQGAEHEVGRLLGSVSGTDILTGSHASRAYAIDWRTGALRWASDPVSARATVFAPVPSGDGVVAGYTDRSLTPDGGGVVMLDGRTGRRRWRAAFARADPSSAAGLAGGPVASGHLVLAAASDGTVQAFDRSMGARRWTIAPVAGEAPPGASPPGEDIRPLTVSGRTLVVGSVSGVLTAIDVDTGRARWQYRSPRDGSIMFALQSDARAVYVPYFSGQLVAVSLITGSELWRTGRRDAAFFFPPALHGETLFLTTETGLYATAR